MEKGDRKTSVSAKRVVGFACSQGFVYSLFYMGLNREFMVGSFAIERIELLGALLAMLFALLGIRAVAWKLPGTFDVLFERHSLFVYAAMMVAGSLVPVFMGALQTEELVFESLMVGAPSAAMTLAWSRAIGQGPAGRSSAEVLLAVGFGGFLCILAYLLPFDRADVILKFLPVLSSVLYFFERPHVALSSEFSADSRPGASAVGLSDLSVRVLGGAVVFGVAAGFMETYNTNPGNVAMASFPATVVLLVLFCAGAYSTVYAKDPELRTGLDGAYRLALLLMMAGFLFTPVLADSGVPGESIVLAGYLGLNAVLIALFLAFARITREDPAVSSSHGLTALFGGEVLGIVLANVSNGFDPSQPTPYVVVCFAGLATLFAYLFLFTERDFRSLSERAQTADHFEEACEAIVAQGGLSKRESEILPLALKGRTSERIAGELFISKSTVDTHLRRIYAKLDVHSRQELIDLGESVAKRLGRQ